MINKESVMVCSLGTYPALGIVKSIKKAGSAFSVITTDIKGFVPGYDLVDMHVKVPEFRCKDYFSFIKSIVDKYNVKAVFLTHLDEILYTASRYTELPLWYRDLLVINDPQSILTANSKSLFSEKWVGAGGIVPEIYTSADMCSSLDFPIVIKPESGQSRGYEKVHIVNSAEEAENYLKESSSDLIIQKFIKGTEYSVHALWHGSDLVGLCPRTREDTCRGVSVKGITADPYSFMEHIRRVKEILPCISFCNLQLIRSEGKDYMIELNPKLPGTLIHTTYAGMNIPSILCSIKCGKEYMKPEIKSGLIMQRYYTESFDYIKR